MKEPWHMGIPNYLNSLVNKPNKPIFLLVCLTCGILITLANRWLYQEFPYMGLTFKVPVGILVAAGAVAELYVFGVVSYRINRLRHFAFGLIQLVVIIALVKVAMTHLREAGMEPKSGPPVFGGIFACVILGWIFGVLLAALDRSENEES